VLILLRQIASGSAYGLVDLVCGHFVEAFFSTFLSKLGHDLGQILQRLFPAFPRRGNDGAVDGELRGHQKLATFDYGNLQHGSLRNAHLIPKGSRDDHLAFALQFYESLGRKSYPSESQPD
jgi:hypothetical protein